MESIQKNTHHTHYVGCLEHKMRVLDVGILELIDQLLAPRVVLDAHYLFFSMSVNQVSL